MNREQHDGTFFHSITGSHPCAVQQIMTWTTRVSGNYPSLESTPNQLARSDCAPALNFEPQTLKPKPKTFAPQSAKRVTLAPNSVPKHSKKKNPRYKQSHLAHKKNTVFPTAGLSHLNQEMAQLRITANERKPVTQPLV